MTMKIQKFVSDERFPLAISMIISCIIMPVFIMILQPIIGEYITIILALCLSGIIFYNSYLLQEYLINRQHPIDPT